mmetsp:Transcript_25504/g.81841  ORF Transcript_25504/g.81841 Transcript_25504/m.81841 type:complete len:274 (-) Transcript_25504:100-921(-)
MLSRGRVSAARRLARPPTRRVALWRLEASDAEEHVGPRVGCRNHRRELGVPGSEQPRLLALCGGGAVLRLRALGHARAEGRLDVPDTDDAVRTRTGQLGPLGGEGECPHALGVEQQPAHGGARSEPPQQHRAVFSPGCEQVATRRKGEGAHRCRVASLCEEAEASPLRLLAPQRTARDLPHAHRRVVRARGDDRGGGVEGGARHVACVPKHETHRLQGRDAPHAQRPVPAARGKVGAEGGKRDAPDRRTVGRVPDDARALQHRPEPGRAVLRR